MRVGSLFIAEAYAEGLRWVDLGSRSRSSEGLLSARFGRGAALPDRPEMPDADLCPTRGMKIQAA